MFNKKEAKAPLFHRILIAFLQHHEKLPARKK